MAWERKLVATFPRPNAMKAMINTSVAEPLLVNAVLTSAINPALHAPLKSAASVVTSIMPPQVRRMNLTKIMALPDRPASRPCPYRMERKRTAWLVQVIGILPEPRLIALPGTERSARQKY